MSTNLLLLCCAVVMTLVAANPIIQTVPFQTCPICQQNAFNIPINDIPTSYVPGNIPMNNIAGNNIPIIYGQPSTSNANSWYPYQKPSSSVNPCSQQLPNINSYGQAVLPQTEIKQSCQQPHAAHSSNGQLNQLFVNKLLENPTIRSMMDPNTRLYNQNGAEIKRQMPVAPNSGGVPSVVNNYFILPPELLINNNNTSKKKQTEEGRRKSVRNHGEERRRKNLNQEVVAENVARKQDLEGEHECDTNKGAETIISSKQNEPKKYHTQATTKEGAKNNDNLRQERERQNYQKRQGRNRNSQQNKQYRNQHIITSHQPTQNTENILEVNNDPKERQANKSHRVQNTNERKQRGKSKNNKKKQETNNGTLDNLTQGEELVKEFKNVTQDGEVPKIQSQREILQTVNLEINEGNVDSEVDKTIKLKTNGKTQSDIQLQNMAIQRNSKDEVLIQDFRNKFPAIPEDLVRNLMSYMKKQIQNEQLGLPHYYYPTFPTNFDNFYQYPNTGGYELHNSERGNERQKSTRRNRTKKRKVKRKKNDENNNSETTIEMAPILMDDSKKYIASTTTEKAKLTISSSSPTAVTTYTTEQSQREMNPAMTKLTEIPQTTYFEREDIGETTTLRPTKQEKFENRDSEYNNNNLKIPELGTEDVVPTIFINDIIDDYYPDFTADNEAYVISNEEYTLKNLHENRYHYTTDRNIEKDENNKERAYGYDNNYYFKYPDNSNRNKDIETVKPRAKSYDEVEAKITDEESIEESEEIEFRTPPTLELPDFETKQIDKDKFRPDRDEYFEDFDDDLFDGYVDDVTDKISSYSNVKTPKYNTKSKITNEVRRPKRKKPKDGNIETIFARSKVVNYSKTSDNLEESPPDPVTKFDIGEKTAKDQYQYTRDGAAIIVAESIGHSGEFW